MLVQHISEGEGEGDDGVASMDALEGVGEDEGGVAGAVEGAAQEQRLGG